MTDNAMINALQQCSKSMWASTTDVNINVGNGHSLMNIAGNDVNVQTGCGNQNITALAMTVGEDTASLFIDTGHCGTDTITGTSQGTATIKTKDGNDTIKLTAAGLFDVDAGVDATESSDDDFVTIYGGGGTADNKNRVSMGFGEGDKLITYADNVDVEKGYGELMMGSIGSNYTVNSLATSHTIGGYGSNYTFNLENDNNTTDDIRSLDYWMEDGVSTEQYEAQKIMKDDNSGSYALKDLVEILDKDGTTKLTLKEYDDKYNSDAVAFFKENLGSLFNASTAVSGGSFSTTSTSDPITVTNNTREALAEKYNLSETEKETLMNLTDEQLNSKFSDGKPMYAIIKSPQLSATAGEDVYVVAVRNGTNVDGALHYASVNKYLNGNAECLKINASSKDIAETVSQTETYTTSTTTTYANAHIVGNLSNWTVNASGSNNGSTNVIVSVGSGELNVNKGTDLQGAYTNKNIFNYLGGHINSTSVTTSDPVKTITSTGINIFSMLITDDTANSPLVLDMNGDGVVSAASGMGVDVNNDGKADGAATNGDKMLAMSDMNGNSKIDGAEVFGDQTVSPFTGEKLNAANGFEALEMIAKEAEKYTGIKCMDGSNVDVQKLAEALATKGIKLGFISDNNVTELEDLAGVKTINTDDYEEVDASGDVQHRQLGSFTTENGETRKVDDVWFKV